MEEKKVDQNEVICMGDQSPWAGGMLRLYAMRKHTSNLKYFFHDGDAPWVFSSLPEPRVEQGWPKSSYFSLATRHPWSLVTPDISLHGPRASLKSPKGLSRLVGRGTQSMIYGMNSSPQLIKLICDFLNEEKEWADRLGDCLGVKNDYELPKCETVLDLAENLNRTDIPIQSFVDLFRYRQPLIKEDLPERYFWEIDFEEGTRKPCRELNGKDVIPKGVALPLEIAARGWALGCTHIGYLENVLTLRDRYLPGLPVKIYHISFDWELESDPVEFLLETFRERKRCRKQKTPDFGDAGEKISSYWRNRPTSVSADILGGNLRPSFVRKVY